MQFSAILTILIAATAVNASPRFNLGGIGKGLGKGFGKGGSKGGSGKGGSSHGGGSNGGGANISKLPVSSQANSKLNAIQGLDMALNTASLAVAIKDTFSGDMGKCEPLNIAYGEVSCSKDGWCWKPCNLDNPTWWAWTSRTLAEVDYNTCSTDDDCRRASSNEISAEGCGC